MGTRSSTETVVALLKAFLDQRTWKQADLARRVETTPATVHKRLVEMQAQGVPLESERDHPHVYWSVPKSWYPGGVLFTGDQLTELLRQLARLPRSKARDKLVHSLLQYLPAPTREPSSTIVTSAASPREEQHLSTVEDAATEHTVLKFHYFSAHRGVEAARLASVHRVLAPTPARFVAVCHRSGTLKWFRVDNVSDARLTPGETFRDVDPKEVDAFLRASLDGYHEARAPEMHVFFVSDPESRWVARNLMGEMQFDDVPGGIQVKVETAGLNRLARYVVGLGSAAKPLTESLAREVKQIAEGALASSAADTVRPRAPRP